MWMYACAVCMWLCAFACVSMSVYRGLLISALLTDLMSLPIGAHYGQSYYQNNVLLMQDGRDHRGRGFM